MSDAWTKKANEGDSTVLIHGIRYEVDGKYRRMIRDEMYDAVVATAKWVHSIGLRPQRDDDLPRVPVRILG